MTNKERVLSISKELDLSHIGSNLSVLPVLEAIYAKKQPGDMVILCNAHAHLSHLIVQGFTDDEIIKLIEAYGIHCDKRAGCDASGGSLGHGLGIGIGYALADKTKNVYVVVSEGSMMEGSSWEALRLACDLDIQNLFVHTNFNGYSAVAKVDPELLEYRMEWFYPHITFHKTSNGEGFEGVEGHYKKA